MRRSGPGPGEVLAFAKRVRQSKDTSPHADGVRAALWWALGLKNAWPLDRKPVRHFPPDMNMILVGARKARAGARRRSVPRLSPEYCAGVYECLAWVCGRAAKPPRV